MSTTDSLENRQHTTTEQDCRGPLHIELSLQHHCVLRAAAPVSRPVPEMITTTASPNADASCEKSSTPEATQHTSVRETNEIQPFPTNVLSEEILHLILYHVLTEPDFGKNGRWSSRDQASRDKAQFSKAHKVSHSSSSLVVQC